MQLNEIIEKFRIDQRTITQNHGKLKWDQINSTLFVMPNNDGEAKRCCQILQAIAAPHLHISKQSWGATLDKELKHINFEQLKKAKVDKILVFEIPGKRKASGMNSEDRVSKEGFELIIIDHHHYHWVDRYQDVSSIEQLADYIGWTLSELDIQVAINDRSYIPGLLEYGLSKEQIDVIRLYDLMAQGHSLEQIKRHRLHAVKKVAMLKELKQPNLWIIKDIKSVEKSFIMEYLSMNTENGKVNALHIGPRKLFFSGEPNLVKKLLYFDYATLGYEKGFHSYGGGDDRYVKFWNFRLKSQNDKLSNDFVNGIVKIIKENL